MTEKEKMLAGEPFETMDRQLAEERRLASERLGRLNALSIDAEGYRKAVTELMPNAAADCLVRPPFHCDYGYNLYIGSEGFINFDCVILDGAPVRIGNHVLIGPAVQIYTFTHPMDYRERRQGIEQCKEIAIGDDCWIGGGAVICPGVILGQRVVVGAGSVVTKDVGPYEIVAGNPARAIRMRFDERQIAALESSRWWELDRHELADRIGELDAMLQNPENPE